MIKLTLKQKIAQKIADGLSRNAVTTASAWTNKYRIMGDGPWSFSRSPWTRAMCDAQEELIIGQKAAQLGFTEVGLNKTFYNIDMFSRSVLYVLPATTPDSSDFSTSRFDPALELSPQLRNLFTDVQNIGHKRAGNASLFIRGSRSRNQMKSLPVSLMVFDEVDEMVQENIPLAFERLSGQEHRQAFMISTPTIEGVGINEYYNDSSQDHYFFICPHCNKMTELVYPDCLVITSDDVRSSDLLNTHIICKECKTKLDHETKTVWLSEQNGAIWVPSYNDRLSRGYHVSQLYSTTLPPWKLAETYLKSLSNPSQEQEFYNSKLGLTHTVKGARITDVEINNVIKPYRMLTKAPDNSFNTMGIDVGKRLHFEIDQWLMDGTDYTANDISLFVKARLLLTGSVADFEELDQLMIDFKIQMAVIDQQPETRSALSFCRRHWGRAKMCYYGQGVTGKDIKVFDEDEHKVTVDRTSWLDLSLGRVRRETIHYPADVPQEYKDHLKALVRVYKEDKDGNQIGRYVNGNAADHLAHARNYNDIAFKIAVDNLGSGNITNIR